MKSSHWTFAPSKTMIRPQKRTFQVEIDFPRKQAASKYIIYCVESNYLWRNHPGSWQNRLPSRSNGCTSWLLGSLQRRDNTSSTILGIEKRSMAYCGTRHQHTVKTWRFVKIKKRSDNEKNTLFTHSVFSINWSKYWTSACFIILSTTTQSYQLDHKRFTWNKRGRWNLLLRGSFLVKNCLTTHWARGYGRFSAEWCRLFGHNYLCSAACTSCIHQIFNWRSSSKTNWKTKSKHVPHAREGFSLNKSEKKNHACL